MKCIFREITKDDFGLDGEIEVLRQKGDGKGYETTGGIIKVQAKSGESYVREDTDSTFSTPVEKTDLETWYAAPYPVFFIVYHPKDNLGNLWRRLALPKRIGNWTLTSLQQRLVRTGGRLIKHARYYWLLLAESQLTRRLFGSMVRRIGSLPLRAG
jgi:hypothetical protein